MISRGNGLPPVLPGTHRVAPPLIFHSYTLLSLPNILLVRSKSATAKICEIKIEKCTIQCRVSAAIDPAKRGTKGIWVELEMLDFRTEHRQ